MKSFCIQKYKFPAKKNIYAELKEPLFLFLLVIEL